MSYNIDWSNKEDVLKAVSKTGSELQKASKKLKNDKDVVLAAINKNPLALKYASERLKNTEDIVLNAINKNASVLLYASDRLKDDKEFMLKAVKVNAMALLHASKNLKDDKNTLGPYIIKSENKDPEKLPESYKLLSPEGNVEGFIGGWSFLDEEGNETSYPSFDVFVGHSAKSKSFNLAPNTVYLYKDFTEHYKNKYPEAGVKTVVVSYTVGIN